MTIDQVSEKLGALTEAVTGLKDDLKEFKEEEIERHDDIEKKLDCLVAKENQRKGMLEQAKKQARIWGAILGAIVAVVFDFIRHQILGN